MRAFYWVRVALVSLEALVLATALVTWTYFQTQLAAAAGGIAASSDVLKFLLLLPLGLVAWVGTEVRHLLHEDKETTRFLTAWSDYWRLKIHAFISLIYSLIFAALSIVPWLLPSGVAAPSGFLLFVTSLLGQLVVVASVYAARLRVKEYVALASAA